MFTKKNFVFNPFRRYEKRNQDWDGKLVVKNNFFGDSKCYFSKCFICDKLDINYKLTDRVLKSTRMDYFASKSTEKEYI